MEHGVDGDGAGTLPNRVYARGELLAYVKHDRRKAQAMIEGLTDREAARPCGAGSTHAGEPFAELLLDNLAHVLEHGAQLSMFLGQRSAPASAVSP